MKKLEQLLSEVRFFGMRAFVFLFLVAVAVFRFLLIRDLLRPAPTFFLIVFFTVFFKACLGVFFLVAMSINSGAACTSNSFPIRFAAAAIDFRANGSATRPIPIARAPKPLPRCL